MKSSLRFLRSMAIETNGPYGVLKTSESFVAISIVRNEGPVAPQATRSPKKRETSRVTRATRTRVRHQPRAHSEATSAFCSRLRPLARAMAFRLRVLESIPAREHARVTVCRKIIPFLLNMQSRNKTLLDDPEVYQCLGHCALTQTNFASLPA